MTNKRVCIIGAGPAGMSCLFQFVKSDVIPEVVCYEKQKTWGGQWNQTWRTGLDENGEHLHSCMYKDLWVNSAKEANLEYPDYTFEQHFGKPIPSYPPAAVMRDYLEGRFTKGTNVDLKKFIQFNTVVRYVRYQDSSDCFMVTVEHLESHVTTDEIFSHVIVCTGIFNYPNVPTFPGTNKFRGSILSANCFRNACEFKGQSVLIVGSSYSATDIAVQCLKFGAKNVIISYRSNPTGVQMPENINERPIVEKFDGNKACFKDGSNCDVDSVILCTGYKNYFPFLESRLRIGEETSLYPKELYKATLLVNAGNNKFFYNGVQNQIYSMTLFDAVALWITRYITETLPGEPVPEAEMTSYCNSWASRLSTITNIDDAIQYQTDLLQDIIRVTGYPKEVLLASDLFRKWAKDREESATDFRDQRFRSLYTGRLATPRSVPYMKAFDDSKEAFLK